MALRTAISTVRRAIVRRCAVGTAVGAVLLVTGGVVPAHADLTGPACMALKLKAWGDLRKCQRAEDANAVKGRSARLNRGPITSAKANMLSSRSSSWAC